MDTQEYVTEVEAVNTVEVMPEKEAGVFVLTLKKPFEYCNKKYEKMVFDFNSLTGKDIEAVEDEMAYEEKICIIPENSPTFCTKLAARAAGIGSDVVANLPAREFLKVKRETQVFLNGLGLD